MLRIRAPERGEYRYGVEVLLTLGPVRGGWSEGPYAVSSGSSLDVELPIPATAWLHDAAGPDVWMMPLIAAARSASTARHPVDEEARAGEAEVSR